MSAVPEAYVRGHMHGGPHDGEIIPMPWARIEVPVLSWDGDVSVVSIYSLAGPWRGQADADYQYRPNGRRGQLA